MMGWGLLDRSCRCMMRSPPNKATKAAKVAKAGTTGRGPLGVGSPGPNPNLSLPSPTLVH